MEYRIALEQFEGPLDLLLRLIESEKLDITTISLAKVTDQYLAFIRREEELPADEVVDFLVVAAKLIYIKSKYLLPSLDVATEEDGIDLEQQLKLYREFVEASKKVHRMIGKHRFSYVRLVPVKLVREAGFSPPTNLQLAGMPAIVASVLARIETVLQLPKFVLASAMSIKEKINVLRERIKDGIVHFASLHSSGKKVDVIVSFLALLELVKQRDVVADQKELFSEITISKA